MFNKFPSGWDLSREARKRPTRCADRKRTEPRATGRTHLFAYADHSVP